MTLIMTFFISVLFPPEAKNSEEDDNDGFYEFSSSLNNFTRYSSLRHLATLRLETLENCFFEKVLEYIFDMKPVGVLRVVIS